MPLAAIRVGAYDCAKIAMLLTGLSFRALCVRMCIDAPDDSTLVRDHKERPSFHGYECWHRGQC